MLCSLHKKSITRNLENKNNFNTNAKQLNRHNFTIKSLRGTFNRSWISLNLKLMPHVLPTSANETIGDEIGDYYLVFYNGFARSVQSVEMLRNTLQHTRQKRWFVVYEHDRFAVIFLEAGGYFSIHHFNVSCLWPDWYCAKSGVVALDNIFTSLSSTAIVRTQPYNQHKKWKFHRVA